MGESKVNTTNAAGEQPAKQSVFQRLYTGTGAFDIVGHRRRWFLAFGALILVCLTSMGLKGFNFGIDFEGGTQIQLPAQGANGVITTNYTEKELIYFITPLLIDPAGNRLHTDDELLERHKTVPGQPVDSLINEGRRNVLKQ